MNPSQARIMPCVQRVSDVAARELDPLWPGVLWRGKTTLLVGDPGLGKSQLSLDIAARVTRGYRWPCSDKDSQVGDVLLLSAEDDVSDTIRPRLEAAGADLNRVHFMSTVAIIGENPEDVHYEWPSLLEHATALREAIEPRPDTRLVVIDPLTAFLGGVDSHKTSEVRTVLALLSQIATDTRVAILAVSHLNKSVGSSAMHRITGSLAFVAAARAAYAVARDPADSDMRVMLCIKNNLAEDSMGYRFSISEADNGSPYVRWADKPCTLSADEVFEAEASPRERAKNVRAADVEAWLLQLLAGGPVDANSAWRQAERGGYSTREVKRACQALRIKKAVAGYQGNWHWSLPENDAVSISVHGSPLSTAAPLSSDKNSDEQWRTSLGNGQSVRHWATSAEGNGP